MKEITLLSSKKMLNNLNPQYIFLTKIKLQISFRSHYVSLNIQRIKRARQNSTLIRIMLESQGTFLSSITSHFYFFLFRETILAQEPFDFAFFNYRSTSLGRSTYVFAAILPLVFSSASVRVHVYISSQCQCGTSVI